MCKSNGGKWSAKKYNGDFEAAASSTYEFQRKLVQTALANDSSGGVRYSFSYAIPSFVVFNVIIGGGGGGAIISSGGGAATAPGGGGATETIKMIYIHKTIWLFASSYMNK